MYVSAYICNVLQILKGRHLMGNLGVDGEDNIRKGNNGLDSSSKDKSQWRDFVNMMKKLQFP
jgi:hypothetical protein